MNSQTFEALVEETLVSCKNLLGVKGAEYSSSADRLANFKRGAMLTGLPAKQVLLIYMAKHFDAVATYCRQGQVEGGEPIYGRIKDLINYCLLLTALIDEENNGKPREAPLSPVGQLLDAFPHASIPGVR